MPDRSDLAGTTIASRYRLGDERSGGSGSSRVFDATDVRRNVRVVLRLTPAKDLIDLEAGLAVASDALEAAKEQAAATARISHPVLSGLEDWGVEDVGGEQTFFTVAEFFEGGSLREFLDRGRRLTPSQALVVGVDVCRALHHLESNGFIHGDLRPANLFLGPDNRVRLANFGVKGALRTNAMSNEQASYAAPELASGEVPTISSDVYSLATTLLELITGSLPFTGETAAITLQSRVGRLLPISADLGPIAPLLERAGRPESAERFSPLEFGKALTALAAKMPRPEPIEALAAKRFEEVIEEREAERTGEILRPTIVEEPTSLTVPVRSGLVINDSVEPIVVPPSEARRHRRLWWIAGIIAVLAIGVVAAQILIRPSHQVPDLSGMNEGEARNAVVPFDWEVVVRAERSDTVPAGSVITTDPVAGRSLREGSTLVLVIAEGETLATLPDVSGLTVDEAVELLTSLELVPTQTQTESEEVDAGRAISWVVPSQSGLKPGDKVLKGTEVQLLISLGPPLREVPSIIGLTLEQAKELLDPLRLDLIPTGEAPSNAAAAGLIGAQSPPPGEKVARDSGIAFSISTGPDLVALPNIIGNNFTIVEQRLQEAGFVVGEVKGRKQNRLKQASIVGQEVANGDLVQRGATVDLVFP
ncbi:MAG: hypothetical protein RLZZ254_1265 [Actinomycetota bacterium]|jgi:serine/threonine-protein kinase